jgi:hypothetical protein
MARPNAIKVQAVIVQKKSGVNYECIKTIAFTKGLNSRLIMSLDAANAMATITGAIIISPKEQWKRLGKASLKKLRRVNQTDR